MSPASLADLAALARAEAHHDTPRSSPQLEPAATPLGKRDCRSDPSKLLFQLIPPEAEEAIAAVLTYGAKHYAPRNWELGLPWSEIVGSLRRHLNAFMKGDLIDAASGLPHVWHVLTNAAMLTTMIARRPDLNDLPWAPKEAQ